MFLLLPPGELCDVFFVVVVVAFLRKTNLILRNLWERESNVNFHYPGLWQLLTFPIPHMGKLEMSLPRTEREGREDLTISYASLTQRQQ